MSGSVTPTTGKSPITIPMLMATCQKSMPVTPTARKWPKRSRALPAMSMRARDEHEVEREQEQAAEEAVLLRPHREDEVGVLLGEERQVRLRPLPPPLAEPLPGADGDHRLRRVVARAEHVAPAGSGTSRRASSGTASGAGRRAPRRTTATPASSASVFQRTPREQDLREADRHDDERGAEVRLLQHEHRRHEDDGERDERG